MKSSWVRDFTSLCDAAAESNVGYVSLGMFFFSSMGILIIRCKSDSEGA